jgi:hypothetical protein
LGSNGSPRSNRKRDSLLFAEGKAKAVHVAGISVISFGFFCRRGSVKKERYSLDVIANASEAIHAATRK